MGSVRAAPLEDIWVVGSVEPYFGVHRVNQLALQDAIESLGAPTPVSSLSVPGFVAVQPFMDFGNDEDSEARARAAWSYYKDHGTFAGFSYERALRVKECMSFTLNTSSEGEWSDDSDDDGALASVATKQARYAAARARVAATRAQWAAQRRERVAQERDRRIKLGEPPSDSENQPLLPEALRDEQPAAATTAPTAAATTAFTAVPRSRPTGRGTRAPVVATPAVTTTVVATDAPQRPQSGRGARERREAARVITFNRESLYSAAGSSSSSATLVPALLPPQPQVAADLSLDVLQYRQELLRALADVGTAYPSRATVIQVLEPLLEGRPRPDYLRLLMDASRPESALIGDLLAFMSGVDPRTHIAADTTTETSEDEEERLVFEQQLEELLENVRSIRPSQTLWSSDPVAAAAAIRHQDSIAEAFEVLSAFESNDAQVAHLIAHQWIDVDLPCYEHELAAHGVLWGVPPSSMPPSPPSTPLSRRDEAARFFSLADDEKVRELGVTGADESIARLVFSSEYDSSGSRFFRRSLYCPEVISAWIHNRYTAPLRERGHALYRLAAFEFPEGLRAPAIESRAFAWNQCRSRLVGVLRECLIQGCELEEMLRTLYSTAISDRGNQPIARYIYEMRQRSGNAYALGAPLACEIFVFDLDFSYCKELPDSRPAGDDQDASERAGSLADCITRVRRILTTGLCQFFFPVELSTELSNQSPPLSAPPSPPYEEPVPSAAGTTDTAGMETDVAFVQHPLAEAQAQNAQVVNQMLQATTAGPTDMESEIALATVAAATVPIGQVAEVVSDWYLINAAMNTPPTGRFEYLRMACCVLLLYGHHDLPNAPHIAPTSNSRRQARRTLTRYGIDPDEYSFPPPELSFAPVAVNADFSQRCMAWVITYARTNEPVGHGPARRWAFGIIRHAFATGWPDAQPIGLRGFLWTFVHAVRQAYIWTRVDDLRNPTPNSPNVIPYAPLDWAMDPEVAAYAPAMVLSQQLTAPPTVHVAPQLPSPFASPPPSPPSSPTPTPPPGSPPGVGSRSGTPSPEGEGPEPNTVVAAPAAGSPQAPEATVPPSEVVARGAEATSAAQLPATSASQASSSPIMVTGHDESPYEQYVPTPRPSGEAPATMEAAWAKIREIQDYVGVCLAQLHADREQANSAAAQAEQQHQAIIDHLKRRSEGFEKGMVDAETREATFRGLAEASERARDELQAKNEESDRNLRELRIMMATQQASLDEKTLLLSQANDRQRSAATEVAQLADANHVLNNRITRLTSERDRLRQQVDDVDGAADAATAARIQDLCDMRDALQEELRLVTAELDLTRQQHFELDQTARDLQCEVIEHKTRIADLYNQLKATVDSNGKLEDELKQSRYQLASMPIDPFRASGGERSAPSLGRPPSSRRGPIVPLSSTTPQTSTAGAASSGLPATTPAPPTDFAGGQAPSTHPGLPTSTAAPPSTDSPGHDSVLSEIKDLIMSLVAGPHSRPQADRAAPSSPPPLSSGPPMMAACSATCSPAVAMPPDLDDDDLSTIHEETPKSAEAATLVSFFSLPDDEKVKRLGVAADFEAIVRQVFRSEYDNSGTGWRCRSLFCPKVISAWANNYNVPTAPRGRDHARNSLKSFEFPKNLLSSDNELRAQAWNSCRPRLLNAFRDCLVQGCDFEDMLRSLHAIANSEKGNKHIAGYILAMLRDESSLSTYAPLASDVFVFSLDLSYRSERYGHTAVEADWDTCTQRERSEDCVSLAGRVIGAYLRKLRTSDYTVETVWNEPVHTKAINDRYAECLKNDSNSQERGLVNYRIFLREWKKAETNVTIGEAGPKDLSCRRIAVKHIAPDEEARAREAHDARGSLPAPSPSPVDTEHGTGRGSGRDRARARRAGAVVAPIDPVQSPAVGAVTPPPPIAPSSSSQSTQPPPPGTKGRVNGKGNSPPPNGNPVGR
ncbi:MAG: hypothetical protein CBB72_011150, partial [Muricauda sp. TMED12]